MATPRNLFSQSSEVMRCEKRWLIGHPPFQPPVTKKMSRGEFLAKNLQSMPVKLSPFLPLFTEYQVTSSSIITNHYWFPVDRHLRPGPLSLYKNGRRKNDPDWMGKVNVGARIKNVKRAGQPFTEIFEIWYKFFFNKLPSGGNCNYPHHHHFCRMKTGDLRPLIGPMIMMMESWQLDLMGRWLPLYPRFVSCFELRKGFRWEPLDHQPPLRGWACLTHARQRGVVALLLLSEEGRLDSFSWNVIEIQPLAGSHCF